MACSVHRSSIPICCLSSHSFKGSVGRPLDESSPSTVSEKKYSILYLKHKNVSKVTIQRAFTIDDTPFSYPLVSIAVLLPKTT